MSAPAVRIDGLGKRYALGRRGGYGSLRESLSRAARAPLRLLRPRPAVVAGPPAAEFWALRGVSFDVPAGEAVGVIGRNGAGKSTLLKILSRITEPTEGAVEIAGRVASLLEVGTGFHPELTGRENVFLNGAILGMSRAEIRRQFEAIVAFAEVDQFLDTQVKHYSSGMYMRLAFAVAAHLDPEVLLVDEVLAVGDMAFQKKCLGKMKAVAGGGRTVLFVSHNMGAVQSFCRQTAVLDGGRLVYYGPTEQAIDRYAASCQAIAGGYADLAGRTAQRRGPRHLAAWRSVRLLDGRGRTAQRFRMGEPLRIRLELEFFRAGEGLEIGVAVRNPHGTSLHYLLSTWEGLPPVPSPGAHAVEVLLPSVALFPGHYNLTLWVKAPGGPYDDGIDEAVAFEVEEAQVSRAYGYFARYSQNTQVYVPSEWTFTGPGGAS